MTGKDLSTPPSYNYAVSALFFLLFFVLFATFGVAILFYGEPFLFWEHAFSVLGDTVTTQGNPNRVSRLIFSIGMLIESGIFLRIRAHYAGDHRFRNQVIKRWLALLGALGFLVSILPNNLFHAIHSLGVGTVVGVLYFFAMFFHFELRERLPQWQFLIDVILLQVVVFPYAIAFFANWESKQSYQKICLMGIFYVLLKAASLTENAFKPREMLQVFRRFQH